MKIKCYFRPLVLFLGLLASQIPTLLASTEREATFPGELRPLSDVLEEISEKYEVIFSYESSLLRDIEVEFEFRSNETIDQAISRLLIQTNLVYQTIGTKYYVLHQNNRQGTKNANRLGKKIKQIEKLESQSGLVLKSAEPSGKMALPSVVRSIVDLKKVFPVTGTVTDEQGNPLIGVTIQVKGKSLGTTSDEKGMFSIEANASDILEVSYLGMKSQEVQVGDRTFVNIVLQEDVSLLDEVVVVGYSTQSKESLTGSVSQVGGDKLEQLPASTFEQALRGSVAGLQASAIDGAPGANTQIRIRGIGSITASSEPLYVIDGVPVQSGDLSTLNSNNGRSGNVMTLINPNDIKSISVLKDAASTAIYGSRGANGVILITTKSGESGKPVFNFKSLVGVSSVASKNILRPLNAAQYTQLFLEGHINNGDSPERAQQKFDATFKQLIDPSTGKPTDTDWLDAILRDGITQSYDLSARGGNQFIKYFFSGAYYDQESFVIGSDFRRMSARSNIDFKASDKITITNNLFVSDTRQNGFIAGGSWQNPFKNSLELSPLIPIRDDQGRFNADHAGYFPLRGANPVGKLSGDDLRETLQTRIIDNFSVNIDLLDNLKFRSQWSFDIISVNESQYDNPRYGDGLETEGQASNATMLNKSWVGTQTLQYTITTKSDNLLDILAGEAQESNRQFHSSYGNKFPNDKLKTLSSASSEFGVAGTETAFAFLSGFARANYNIAGKYYLSASFRRDGSSRFGSENRWGTFYSFGGGWILSEENFFSKSSWLDLLKVRSSWGLTGNAAIGDFPWQGLYTYGSDYFGSPGGRPNQIANPGLGWEIQKNFNVGLDFGFFSKVSGTVEYFQRISSDLILDVPISLSTGFESLTQNFGEMTNTGLEITLDLELVNAGDFSWSAGFNTTFLQNRITRLTEDYNDGDFRRQEGQDFQSFYLLGWAGVDQTNGKPQWWTDETKTELTSTVGKASRFLDGQSATPKHYGGFRTMLNYKGLSLSAQFVYSYGNYLLDTRARGSISDGRLAPRSTAVYAFENRWVPGKTDAIFPQHKWGGQSGSNQAANSRWLYDGSYLRLRDLTLGYVLPDKIVSNLRLTNARVYFRGTNFLTFTKVKDLYLDPEQAIDGTFDAMTPAMKTLSFGIDISL
jgi:TonB-dependent starch-binding outer membrane protein SusC